MPSFRHTEPRRGTKWWGMSVLVLLRFSKVTRRKGGTLSRRYRRNGYTHQPQNPPQKTKPKKTAPFHF
ncbi:hypothetical protein B1219_03975 [Pseudomonas ogarae]|nr:hypothetical protein B1219_03975 [Pseudomonas ogarae]